MSAVTAPTTAIGYTQGPNFDWWSYENETTPELVWPQSIYVYDQMRRQDSQVYSVLRAVTETLLRTPWRIDPAGARARVTKFVADDLGLPIVGRKPTPPPRARDRFSWTAHLREALLMLPHGHSYFEQIYRVTDDGSAAHLRKLEYRPARTIERVDVASDGGLVAIKQCGTAGNVDPKPIPVDHLVAYIHAREGGNWLGTSILRPAYKNWLLKDRLLRVQTQTIERNGMGIPLYTAQEGASETDLAAGKAMATAWRAGEAAGSAVPFGADLVLRGVEGTLPDAQPAIDYHDSQIARAVLAHFLNLGAQTGSWALGTTFADFFTMSLQTLAEQIRDVATQHIVEDLVDVNFGPSEPAPRLVFDEIGSRQAATAAALKTLVDAGVIHPDQVLEESARQQYGLPPADPATAAPPPGAAPAASPDVVTPTGALSVAAGSIPKEAAAPAAEVRARFNPSEARVPGGEHGGQWTATGALKDALKLDGKISLAPGEKLTGSDSVLGDNGQVSFAWIDRNGSSRLRLGALGGENADRWRGANKGATLDLDEYQAEGLRSELRRMSEAGKEAATEFRTLGRQFDKVEAVHGNDPAAMPDDVAARYEQMRERYDELIGDAEPFAAGVVHSDWGQLHVGVRADENGDGYAALLAVKPRGAPDDWDLAQEVYGNNGVQMDKAQLAKLIRKLAAAPVQAAAGHDVTPGHDELHHYWTKDPEGLAKWADSPKPWTTLVAELAKHVGPEKAKVFASRWFIEVFGYAAGSDKNRVAHGHAPRGHRIGPG